MPIRAVLFDLGDTLVRLEPFPSDLSAALAERLASHRLDASLAADLHSTVAAEIRAASRDAPASEVRIAASLQAALGRLPDGIAFDLADTWGVADIARIKDVPGREALLVDLRRLGLQLGIVSNTTTRPELLDAMLEGFGLRSAFDAVIYSSAVGTRKPHAAIYEAALSKLAVAPGETVFVGDRLREDVLGPSRLGMTALLTHEFYRDEHGGEPYAVLERLEDIIGILDRLA